MMHRGRFSIDWLDCAAALGLGLGVYALFQATSVLGAIAAGVLLLSSALVLVTQ